MLSYLFCSSTCHRPTHLLRRSLIRFAKREDGSMIIFAMFIFILMMVSFGMATDMARYEMNRSKFQATMDRALLAAAHPDMVLDRKDVVQDYFEKAGMDVVKREDITVVTTATGAKVSAVASMDMITPFASMVGVTKMAMPAFGTAEKANPLTEVSLVVDVSGSMGRASITEGETKIQKLREAATEFTNLLLCNPNDPSTSTNCTIDRKVTSVSLVPYSTQVNVGQELMSHFSVMDQQTDGYCATFADDDFNSAVIDPAITFRQAARFYRYLTDRDRVDPDNEDYGAYWSCHNDSWREIVALEDSPTQMATRIAALGAEGDTAIDIGLKWGVALLQDEVQPVVSDMITNGLIDSAFDGRPYDPDVTSSAKFVVLMTDGQNTRHHHTWDGRRAGSSPFWYNSGEDDPENGIDNRGIFSVLDDRDTVDTSDDRYRWYSPSLGRYHTNTAGRTIWMSHPFGAEGLSADICFTRYTRRGDLRNRICPKYDDPLGEGYSERWTYQKLWRNGYTWGFHQRFNFLGKDPVTPAELANPFFGSEGEVGRLLDNSNIDGTGRGEIDARLLDQCDAAKASGVTIYTIEMETPDTAAPVLRTCASVRDGAPLHYKATGSNISDIFQGIAEDINKLRLTN